MLALSIIQPWATLTAIGAKLIETRAWATTHRGMIAIHASRNFNPECRELASTEPFANALRQPGVQPPSLTAGRILEFADLIDCLPVEMIPHSKHATLLTKTEQRFGDFTPGRYGWVLANARPLPKPIRIPGALRLWEVPEQIVVQIARQLHPSAKGARA